jgi:hypothetical protein
MAVQVTIKDKLNEMIMEDDIDIFDDYESQDMIWKMGETRCPVCRGHCYCKVEVHDQVKVGETGTSTWYQELCDDTAWVEVYKNLDTGKIEEKRPTNY